MQLIGKRDERQCDGATPVEEGASHRLALAVWPVHPRIVGQHGAGSAFPAERRGRGLQWRPGQDHGEAMAAPLVEDVQTGRGAGERRPVR